MNRYAVLQTEPLQLPPAIYSIAEDKAVSEFSSSYHLHNASQADAVTLIERSGRQGFAFPASDNWSTFIVSGQPLSASEDVIRANEGTLLYYWNAEDHGWGFSAFEGPMLAVQFERDWEEDAPSVSDAELSPLVRLVPGNAPRAETKETLRDILTTDIDDTGEEQETPPYRFARLLGLEYFEWLSYDNWLAEVRAGRNPYPGKAVGLQIPSRPGPARPRCAASIGHDGDAEEQEIAAGASGNELVGRWLVVAWETRREKKIVPPTARDQYYEFTLDGRLFIVNEREKRRVEFKYSCDSSATPKQLNLQWLTDHVTDKGIYEIEGNDLRWCCQMHWYAKLGESAERPKDFSTDHDAKLSLLNFRRVPLS